jgi:hypothetical protein
MMALQCDAVDAELQDDEKSNKGRSVKHLKFFDIRWLCIMVVTTLFR